MMFERDSPENYNLVMIQVTYWIDGQEFERDVEVHKECPEDQDLILSQLPSGIDDYKINN